MKKYLLVASLVLNVLLAGYLVRRHYSFYKAMPKADDSIVTFSFNKYKVFKDKQEQQEQLPIDTTDMVLFGNSLTEGFPMELFDNADVKNRGISGNNTIDMCKRIGRIAEKLPAKLFIMGGINDLGQSVPADTTFKNIARMVQTVRKISPRTKIYLQSVLPVSDAKKCLVIQKYNRWIRDFAQRERITYIDLFADFYNGSTIRPELTLDGTHLKLRGYFTWRDGLKKYIWEK